MLEVVEKSEFYFGGDVGEDLGDAVGEVVAEASCLGDFGCPAGNEPGFVLCRSPWKVRPGLMGTVRTRLSGSVLFR
ncbi:hypothetical protein DMH04_07190 [Kibdelosporangium aridum]|uniref:Uncharacterized protein n=1 Tax=Kibdelosporangium aridum TaxID=2030 RepID=A0A428ZNX7_KIBAR|nr:hypothetical protein DMH04_07190 [Kibdelosporangium aridum]